MRLHHLIFASLVATSAVGTAAAESPVIGVASVIDGDTLEIHDQRIRRHCHGNFVSQQLINYQMDSGCGARGIPNTK